MIDSQNCTDEASCTNICKMVNGTWSQKDSLCYIYEVLTHICLEVDIVKGK